jgi:hypothetical protein
VLLQQPELGTAEILGLPLRELEGPTIPVRMWFTMEFDLTSDDDDEELPVARIAIYVAVVCKDVWI